MLKNIEYFYSKNKLQLHDFNNLTKTLTFNIYDFAYTETDEQKRAYIKYIDTMYSADRLTEILTNVVNIIGANILNVAKQDYEPQGSSVTILVSEGELIEPNKDTVVAHLDKSHITVHTYPEHHPEIGISTFRADIDVSTCGLISPLKSLNYLLEEFKLPDIVIADYKVRGFTRDVNGNKIYIDHAIESIQDFMTDELCNKYISFDVNNHNIQTFNTRLLIQDLNIDKYTFGDKYTYEKSMDTIRKLLNKEMYEVYYGRNIP